MLMLVLGANFLFCIMISIIISVIQCPFWLVGANFCPDNLFRSLVFVLEATRGSWCSTCLFFGAAQKLFFLANERGHFQQRTGQHPAFRRELSRKIFVCFIYVWVSGVCLLTILHNIFYSWTAATCFLLYIHLTSIEIKYERLNDQAIFLLCMKWIITCLPLFRFSLHWPNQMKLARWCKIRATN